MAKSVLVIEADDLGKFFLSVESGLASIGAAPGRPEAILRELRIARIRCEIDLEDDAALVDRPAAEGQSGSQRTLYSGQNLRLAHSHLQLQFDPTTEGKSASPPAAVPAPPPSAAAPSSEKTFRRLRVIDGADLGRAFRLPEVGSLSIGRSANHANIVLHDLYVSRVHCQIEAEVGKLHVEHREGDNGTLINGQRIAARQELQCGDVLRVGNSHLRLETALTLDSGSKHEEPAEESPPARQQGAVRVSDGKPTHELVGQVLGPYSIIELLGRGHSSDVFRAQHQKTNLVVALKVLAREFPADGQELQKFAQALKTAGQFHHINLVGIHTAGRSGNHCWIAREYVEGESVADVVKRLAQRSKINWTRSARVAVHLARALTALHKHRVVHGNITPANVLISENKTTKLADLMLGKALEGSRLQESILEKKLLAELPYLAPEQTSSDTFVDHLADLYGLGALLWTLLTGQPPFEGDSPAEIIEQIRTANVVRPSKFQKGIPAAFEEVVLKLMARNQEDRISSATELLGTVEEIAQEHEVEV